MMEMFQYALEWIVVVECLKPIAVELTRLGYQSSSHLPFKGRLAGVTEPSGGRVLGCCSTRRGLSCCELLILVSLNTVSIPVNDWGLKHVLCGGLVAVEESLSCLVP